MKNQKGFTVIELIAAITLLMIAGAIFVYQKKDVEVYHQDSARKTSINAIHHHLEKIYFTKNQHYPERITKEALPGIAPELLIDPSGLPINEINSSLRYEPTNCNEGKCRGYSLRADLEREADFVKQSTNG